MWIGFNLFLYFCALTINNIQSMKKITLLFVLLFTYFVNAQENSFDGKTLILKNGGSITVGEDLTLGKGTKDNGYFRYIEVNSQSMMRAYNTNGTNWGVQDANSMSSQYNDLKGKVIKIQERGNRRTGKKWYAVIGVGDVRRYQVDIENALISGEILVEGSTLGKKELEPKTENQMVSKADELLKIKTLLEDGLITEEEFNQMKSEILSK